MARHRAEHDPDTPSDADASDADLEPTTGEPDESVEPNDSGVTDDEQPDSAESATDDSDSDDESESDDDDDTDDESESTRERTAEVNDFWREMKLDPIEVALPAGVGYTLRAYRDPDEVSGVDGNEPNDADEPATVADAGGQKRRVSAAADTTEDNNAEDSDTEDSDTEYSDGESDADTADDDGEPTDGEDALDEDEDALEEEEEDDRPEEVPVFLSQGRRLLLFHSPEALVAFVRGDEPHALRGIDGYETLAERLEVDHVVADDQDHYELDLLVGNLRGGHDTWEPRLVVSAGELARDVGYALGLSTILTSLAPGSPLDELDEAMRSATRGGFSAFRARRRMRKIGAQQAALAWRTIIGKISAAVDWRD